MANRRECLWCCHPYHGDLPCSVIVQLSVVADIREFDEPCDCVGELEDVD